jgi:hypothetical protein
VSARDFYDPAVVYRQRFFEALIAEPIGDFPVCDDLCADLVREGHSIRDMVKMTARNHNHIRLDAWEVDGGCKRVWAGDTDRKAGGSWRFPQKKGWPKQVYFVAGRSKKTPLGRVAIFKSRTMQERERLVFLKASNPLRISLPRVRWR